MSNNQSPIKKEWGLAWDVYNDGKLHITKIEVEKGGFCGQHAHKEKTNQFFIISGQLKVITATGGRHILTTGQSVLVPAGVVHHFEAPEATVAIEVYRPASGYEWVDPKDIQRFSEGGVRKRR